MSETAMIGKTLSAAFLAIAMLMGATAASADSLCDVRDFKERASGSSYSKRSLAFLMSVDETRFNQIKRDFSNDSEIIIYGIPIKGDTKWSEFRDKRSAISQRYQLDYDQEDYVAYYRATMGVASLAAYQACLLNEHRGLRAYVSEADQKNGILRLVWDPLPIAAAQGEAWSQTVSLTVEGATLQSDRLSASPNGYKIQMLRGGNDQAIVVRAAGAPKVVIIANAISTNGASIDSANVTIPPDFVVGCADNAIDYQADPTCGKARGYAEIIRSGEEFWLTFDQSSKENRIADGRAKCNIDHGGYLGNFIAGETYRAQYSPVANTYTVSGPNQGKKRALDGKCGNYVGVNRGPNPENGHLSLWKMSLYFDENGIVWSAAHQKVGQITVRD